MNEIIKELDDLFITQHGHSKVMIDFEDKAKTVRFTYKQDRGYGEKAVVIIWQNNEIIDVRTNYNLSKNDTSKMPTKETIVSFMALLLTLKETSK